MDIREAFNRAAAPYDGLRRQLIPCFDGFYGAVLDLLPETLPRDPRVLDLGAGTGLLADQVMGKRPEARLTLMDLSEGMLDQARARFAGRETVRFRVGDYVREDLEGPWDLVVSALSIHHLEDGGKRALYGRIFQSLALGALFINADNIRSVDPAVQERDRTHWIERIRASGLPQAELETALERTTLDRLAPLDEQLDWLREAGFEQVDCVYKWRHFAVFSGGRGGTAN